MGTPHPGAIAEDSHGAKRKSRHGSLAGRGQTRRSPAQPAALRRPRTGSRDPAHARPLADSRRPHLPLGLPALRARQSLPLCPARLARGPGNAAPPPAPTGIIAPPSAAPSPPDRTPLRPPHRPRTRCGALRPGCGEAAAAESRAALARPVAPPRVPRRRPSAAAAAASAGAGRLPPPARLTLGAT